MANPAVVELMLDHHDALSTFISIVQQVTPAELVVGAGFSRRPHGLVLHTMKDLIETAQVSGRDINAQLIDMGFVDVLVDCLKSAPEVGWQKCNGVVCTWGFLWTLLVISGERMEEIEARVCEQRYAIRYLIDNNVIFAHAHGIESSTFSCVLAANLFGKDEENSFGITQEEINGFIDWDTQVMACNSWGGIVSPGYNQGRPLLQLCISDRNKEMLIGCPGFIPHVLSSLMLDPGHARQGTPQAIKEQVQGHYAECLQQISLFPAGRQALKANSAVVQTLDVLAVKGWTDAAKQSASATLFETSPERMNRKVMEQPASNGTEPDGHVFISYQWDVQEIIKRLVHTLEQRKYVVWFDLTKMQGSIMDGNFPRPSTSLPDGASPLCLQLTPYLRVLRVCI